MPDFNNQIAIKASAKKIYELISFKNPFTGKTKHPGLNYFNAAMSFALESLNSSLNTVINEELLPF